MKGGRAISKSLLGNDTDPFAAQHDGHSAFRRRELLGSRIARVGGTLMGSQGQGKRQRRRSNDPVRSQAGRAFRSSLFDRFRSHRRFRWIAKTPTHIIARRVCPPVVDRHGEKSGCIQGTFRSCLGRSMGTDGCLLCERESRSNCKTLDDGKDRADANVRWSFVRCRMLALPPELPVSRDWIV